MDEIVRWIGDRGSAAIAVSLLTLAGSVFAYVVKLFLDLADRRHAHFLGLISLLDGSGPIAGKMAAVYELSQYRRKRDFLIRFFEGRDVLVSPGGSSELLKEEMRIAADYLKSLR